MHHHLVDATLAIIPGAEYLVARMVVGLAVVVVAAITAATDNSKDGK